MFDPKSLYAKRVRSTHGAFVRDIFARSHGQGVISFSGGLPNPDFFPIERLIAATERAMRADGRMALQYGQSDGYEPLREWVAGRYRRQGLAVTADMVVIMSGSLQGIDLAAKTFLEPGDTLLIEAPAFLGAIQTLRMWEPRFVGVPVTDEGIDTQALERALDDNPTAKLLEVCPSNQNPTGVTYSPRVRAEFARVLHGRNIAVLEDDPYAELRFDGSQPASLRRELGDQVISLGSFSKIVAPGLRLGWVVASRDIAPLFALGKQSVDSHASLFAQRVLYQYLIDNDIDAHIAAINAAYRRNRDAMLGAMERYFPPEVHFTRPQGGMFVWVTMPEGSDALTLFRDAVEHEKVAVVPGAPFYTDGQGGRHQFRMSYATVDVPTIEEGVRRLARALARHLDPAAP